MKTSHLKRDIFLVSLVVPLLLILIVLDLFHITPQTQNIEATNITQRTSSSYISELIQKGNTMLNSSKYEEALVTFDQVLKTDTRSVDALTGKGLIFNQLGRYEEAIPWFDKALSIDPKFVDALYNKADALGELGEYEEAIVWTDKALALEPANQNDSNSKLLLPNE